MNTKGSQWQIQGYVNDAKHVDVLDCAIATALGSEFLGEIEWVSPLLQHGFAEQRDGAFLTALGCEHLIPALSKFWPSGGPRWDALARGKTTKQVFLVEAKSYSQELRGTGSGAGDTSLAIIQSSLRDTALWLQINNGVPPTSWTKHLYQSANRLAHLHFLRRSGVDAFLLNVCFVNDPHRPTKLQEWRDELLELNNELGVKTSNLTHVRNIFLPAVF